MPSSYHSILASKAQFVSDSTYHVIDIKKQLNLKHVTTKYLHTVPTLRQFFFRCMFSPVRRITPKLLNVSFFLFVVYIHFILFAITAWLKLAESPQADAKNNHFANISKRTGVGFICMS
jgi:hypothetical protein